MKFDRVSQCSSTGWRIFFLIGIGESPMNSSSVSQQQNPRLVKTSNVAVCGNPTLPQEFIELCRQSGSSLVFSRLAAVPPDVCEICAFAACTGY
ncbi:guanylin-like [Tachysurus fulvidraco]|uniref:guanylin-like n=1 Tax=Tachysurus fulvidraco TaxID=1234273 RepID=UPI001FEF6AF6|nr:guanylin-like [Tachysurus fulvidraco]